MSNGFLRNAVVLGLLSAIGPFAIDMYIPALPSISADLGASVAATQLTLTAFFVAFGLCQIVYGPVSDMVGRKPPLYFGVVVFALGSLGAAMSPSIEWLIFFRAVQGIGASSVMVIPRAIIRDLHTGVDAARLMSLVMLVFSVVPILAPLAGSALIVPFGWRSVFFAVAAASVLSFVLVLTALRETRPPEQRIRASVGTLATGFGKLLRDWRFLGLTFIGGLGMSSFFAFIASASFIYMDHFGLSPIAFSVAFSVNAVGFITASQFSARLGSRYGLGRVITTAASSYAVFAVLLLAVTLAGVDSLAVLMALLFVAFASLGLVIPSTMVLALEEHGPIAGMASALGGTLQMVAGGVMITIMSLLFNGTVLPLAAVIAACAVGALVLAYVTLVRGREPVPAPGE